MNELDIDDFRVTTPTPALLLPPKAAKRRRLPKHVLFVPGPLPLAVLKQFRLPIAFRVYVALQTRKRMGYSPRLARDFLGVFGLSKGAAQRGLRQLERLGLARVTRRTGCASEAELLIPEDAAPDTFNVQEDVDGR